MLPVVFAFKAKLPTATLKSPVVFAVNALVPILTLLPAPLIVKLPELTPTNVLRVPKSWMKRVPFF